MTPEKWGQLKELFRVAAEHEPQQRAAFLDQACVSDPALRAEIESLLASHDDAANFIETPAVDRAVKAIAESSVEQLAGRRIGAYRLIREIGRGGMGTVYLAERADEQYRKLVAIKVVRRGMDSDDIIRHFRNERQILASLENPNIAGLLDGGTTEDGRPYLVMEYVEGTPVTEYCDARRLTTEARLRLFRTICDTVHYAHQNLVIHRDLKPSNILITQTGTPKLLDFGIAKVLNPETSTGATERTRTEQRALTPDYASPEQILGEKPTTASDVYSLSIVLYELLTGHRPYRSLKMSAQEMVRLVCEHEPTKPSDSVNQIEVVTRGHDVPANTITPEAVSHARTTQPDKLRRELTGDLDNIVLMALRKEPQRRYESAAQFSEDIERYLNGLPVLAREDTFGYRASKFLRRQKRGIWAASTVLMALLIGIFTSYLYLSMGRSGTEPVDANPLSGVKTLAVLPLKSLSNPPQDQELRVGMADSIVTKLSAVKQLAVRPTSSTIRYLDQDYDVLQVGHELKVETVLEGTLQKDAQRLEINLHMVSVGDGKVLWSESFTNDLSDVLRGQTSVANRVSRQLALKLDNDSNGSAAQGTPNISAQELYLKGNFALTTSARKMDNIFEARDYFEHAIRVAPNFAQAHAGLALTYTLAASLNLLSPQESYPKAQRAARRALEIEPNQASAYTALAEIESDYNWNWAAAEAYNRRALELTPNSASAHHTYAEFLARMGRFDEAAYHSDMAHLLDPTRINYEAVRALHYFYEHRLDDTIAQSRMVIEKDSSAYLAYLYYSVAQADKGNFDEGIAAAQKAIDLMGGGPSDLFVLACNYALANDRAKTDAVLAKMQALSKQRYVDPFFFVVIYNYRGEKDRAFAYLEKSYAEKSYWMTSIKVHPVLDALRSDPRFARMLKKMKLDG
jgi:serine/threonine protein kinase/tetratricopeptide (TPR) repeat protein